MSTSFGQRLLALSPFGDNTDNDLEYDEEADRYYNSSSALLESDNVNFAWSFSLAKLREKRRRPFVGAGIAMGIFGLFLIISALSMTTSFALHWRTMASQSLVSIIGMACSGAIALFATLHLVALYNFSNNDASPNYVRFTDMLQKLSIIILVANVASIMKLWVDAPPVLLPNTVLTYILHPNRVWMFGNCATVAVLMMFFIFVGTSIPYRKINEIYSSNIRTLTLLTLGVAVSVSAFSMTTLLSYPDIYFNNALMWGTCTFNIALALLSIALIASVHGAQRLNALWILVSLATLGGSCTLSVFNYLNSSHADNIYLLAILSCAASVLNLYTFLHMAVWRYVNFYDAAGRFSNKTRKNVSY